MTPPDAFLAQLIPLLEQDRRIGAAWLTGSYGRGNPDRWSDIDLHLLASTGSGEVRAGLEALLSGIRPLVLFKWLFDGRMANVLTVDGVRLDIWCIDQPAVLDPAKTKVLFDRAGVLRLEALAPPAAPNQNETANILRSQIDEFWRCIALLPTVIGRQEYIVAFRGLSVELDLVLELLLRGYKIEREAGAKRLNPQLGTELRAEVEQAITLHGLTAPDLVQAHLALATIVVRHGPALATIWGFDYPLTLQEAVRQYVENELAQLGMAQPGTLAM